MTAPGELVAPSQVELFAWLDPGLRWGHAGATLCDVELDL